MKKPDQQTTQKPSWHSKEFLPKPTCKACKKAGYWGWVDGRWLLCEGSQVHRCKAKDVFK